MLSHTSYLPNLFKSNLEVISFDDIFSLIKSDEHLETLTFAYRTNPFANEVDRKQLKQQFPCFFPTVNLGQNDVNKLTPLSIPTGIVQFDVDIKDNPDVNVGTLITKLTDAVPELAYYFISPSGGLKFGLRTDFINNQDELYDEEQSLRDTKERFRTAYQIAKAYVLSVIPGVVFDDSTATLKLGCFLAHDPEAYLNVACDPYLLNDQCFSSHLPRERLQTYGTVDVEKVKTLLSFIPRDLRYNERLPFNAAVLNSINEAGIDILFNHWTTDNRDKLKADLQYQLKHRLHHNIGYLYNQARQYGYRAATTGRARKKLAVRYLTGDTPMTHLTLKELFTIEEAKNAMSTAVERFFRDRKDILINSSIGIGKSEEVLRILKQTPRNVNALYINTNHALLAELKGRFDALESDRKPGTTHSTVQHIQGKTRLCEYKPAKIAYQGVPIPRQQCEQDCPLFAECAYTTQFQPYANIRLIAANDLFNEPASYDSNWKPDVVIIDENFLKLETYTETLETDWKSIRNIILDCERYPLKDAIENHKEQVLLDFVEMKKQRRNSTVRWKNMKQYLQDIKKQKNTWSEILQACRDYLVTEDDTTLSGLRRTKTGLRMTRVQSIHNRFHNIPKLILDATADERLIKHLFPSIEWVSIHAAKRETTKLIQLENFVITKNWLQDNKQKQMLVDGLKRLIQRKGYQKVGLITYLNVGTHKNFDHWLAQQIGTDLYDHFGNIRGKNIFEAVDCLLVVGRHELDPASLDDWVYAVYNKPVENHREAVEVPVRMTVDRWGMIENLVYPDDEIESVRRHLCQAETAQAVGRSRWYNDKPKDVYLLSCESLGTNVIVDEWIKFDDLFGQEQSKPVDDRTRVQKIADYRKEQEDRKRLEILQNLNFPNIKDDYNDFEAIGFSKTFSRSKPARIAFMPTIGYELVDGVWVRS